MEKKRKRRIKAKRITRRVPKADSEQKAKQKAKQKAEQKAETKAEKKPVGWICAGVPIVTEADGYTKKEVSYLNNIWDFDNPAEVRELREFAVRAGRINEKYPITKPWGYQSDSRDNPTAWACERACVSLARNRRSEPAPRSTNVRQSPTNHRKKKKRKGLTCKRIRGLGEQIHTGTA